VEGVLERLLRLGELRLRFLGVLDLLTDHLLPLAHRLRDERIDVAAQYGQDQQEGDELGEEGPVREQEVA